MSVKRVAQSPSFLDNTEKKPRGEGEVDLDATILNEDFLSSTLVDSEEKRPGVGSRTMAGSSVSEGLKGELRALLTDPDIVEVITMVVSEHFNGHIKKFMGEMREQIVAQHREIVTLKERVDELEQYGRRNSFRLSGVPESSDENTDEIVKTVAKSIGVDISDENIDRSHRVGPKPAGGSSARPILVKMATYRSKRAVMVRKRKLAEADPRKLFPGLRWPSSPPPSTPSASQSSSQPPQVRHRLYINDDLTRARAEVAAAAREKKRKKAIENTWVRDGVIFVLARGQIHRVTTKQGITEMSKPV